MALNHYFNQKAKNEQSLYEDIIIESLKIYGQDVYYLPREIVNENDIFGEDVPSKFSSAHKIEMYIENTEGFDGEGDLFTKFGVEIRDAANFVVSRRRWRHTVEQNSNTITGDRPREGDVLYLPLSNSMFEIMHVEHEQPFYQLSNLPVFKLRAQLFEYNDEDFETGDEVIDDMEHAAAYTVSLTLGTGTGSYFKNEIVYQGSNLAYATASAEAKHWIPETKVLEVINVKGDFAANSIVIGTQSNTRYNLTSSDTLADLVDSDDSDNRIIQTEADTFIDLSEINPFGVP